MTLALSPADVAALPAILLLGARQSGKSQTLASWAAQFRLWRRDGNEFVSVVHQGVLAFRSDSITEYLVEIDQARFRVFDVPGEILEQRLVSDPGETTGAGRMRERLLSMRPRVAGVIAFAVPPTDDAEVGCIEDRRQLAADRGRQLGEGQAVEQLRQVLELVQGFVRQRLLDDGMPAPVVVVQIGFVDLVRWREADLPRLRELHVALNPGSSSSMRGHAFASRERLYAGLDELANSTFTWLDRVRDAAPGAEFGCVPVSNQGARPPSRLPGSNTGAGLLWVADQIEGARQRVAEGIESERRRAARDQRLQRMAIVALAAILVVGLGLFMAVSKYAPGWLPGPWAVSACSNLSQPEERCDCVEVIARNATTVPFRQRLDLIAPLVAACGRAMMDSMPPRRPQLMSLAAQVELARGAAAPAEFSAARYESAVRSGGRPGTFPGPMPWYPAEGAGEVQALKAVQALAEGQPMAEVAKRAEGITGSERQEFIAFLRLLNGTKGAAACLNEWARAREAPGWRAPAAPCGREGERLPPELQLCYRADAALGFPEGLPQPPTSPCAEDVACSRGKGLEAQLLRAPRPDAHTFANLAARAATPQEFSQCLGKALGANPAHLLMLRLLGPGSFEERLAAMRNAGDGAWPAAGDWVRREWVVAEWGRRVGTPKPRALPQRLPVLPLRQVAEAACALMEAPAMYSPPAVAVPWREPMETDPLQSDTAATHRARVALALLTAAGEVRTPQSAGCELAAAVTLLRLPQGPDHPALLRRLNAAFGVFEAANDAPEAATTRMAAAKLRCRLGPAFAPSPEVARSFEATYGCAAVAEAGSAPQGNPVATR